MKKLSMDQLQRCDVETYKSIEKTPLIVILDNVRSLNNIGSVFRTSDAFRLTAIYLCGITATPPHKEIHKTALGAEDSVDWCYYKTTREALHELRSKQWKIYAVEQTQNSTSLQSFIPEKGSSIAIVLGNEVEGVGEDVLNESDGTIEIPQFGTKHSLNVSVAAGIVIWDLFSKMNSEIK